MTDYGPLPEPDMFHRKALDDCDEEASYSAEAMEAERKRCYALGVAAERERSERLRQALLKCKTCALPTEVRELVSSTIRA